MSVISYLSTRASSAVLSADERSSVATSVTTLQSRLDAYFDAGQLSEHLKFGSYTRDTILPRAMDAHSDIDYMVVFGESGLQPQTYLDRLKRFVEARYQTSQIYQSSPTIVLELNHIKFELVPALKQYLAGYQIPRTTITWQSSNPNDFNATLAMKNVAASYYLKPAIRLLKFWNAKVGYVYNSYLLEKWVADQYFYGCNNVRDYLFSCIEKLSAPTTTQWQTAAVERAKSIVATTKKYEADAMPYWGEAEIKKLIPE